MKSVNDRKKRAILDDSDLDRVTGGMPPEHGMTKPHEAVYEAPHENENPHGENEGGEHGRGGESGEHQGSHPVDTRSITPGLGSDSFHFRGDHTSTGHSDSLKHDQIQDITRIGYPDGGNPSKIQDKVQEADTRNFFGDSNSLFVDDHADTRSSGDNSLHTPPAEKVPPSYDGHLPVDSSPHLPGDSPTAHEVPPNRDSSQDNPTAFQPQNLTPPAADPRLDPSHDTEGAALAEDRERHPSDSQRDDKTTTPQEDPASPRKTIEPDPPQDTQEPPRTQDTTAPASESQPDPSHETRNTAPAEDPAKHPSDSLPEDKVATPPEVESPNASIASDTNPSGDIQSLAHSPAAHATAQAAHASPADLPMFDSIGNAKSDPKDGVNHDKATTLSGGDQVGAVGNAGDFGQNVPSSQTPDPASGRRGSAPAPAPEVQTPLPSAAPTSEGPGEARASSSGHAVAETTVPSSSHDSPAARTQEPERATHGGQVSEPHAEVTGATPTAGTLAEKLPSEHDLKNKFTEDFTKKFPHTETAIKGALTSFGVPEEAVKRIMKNRSSAFEPLFDAQPTKPNGHEWGRMTPAERAQHLTDYVQWVGRNFDRNGYPVKGSASHQVEKGKGFERARAASPSEKPRTQERTSYSAEDIKKQYERQAKPKDVRKLLESKGYAKEAINKIENLLKNGKVEPRNDPMPRSKGDPKNPETPEHYRYLGEHLGWVERNFDKNGNPRDAKPEHWVPKGQGEPHATAGAEPARDASVKGANEPAETYKHLETPERGAQFALQKSNHSAQEARAMIGLRNEEGAPKLPSPEAWSKMDAQARKEAAHEYARWAENQPRHAAPAAHEAKPADAGTKAIDRASEHAPPEREVSASAAIVRTLNEMGLDRAAIKEMWSRIPEEERTGDRWKQMSESERKEYLHDIAHRANEHFTPENTAKKDAKVSKRRQEALDDRQHGESVLDAYHRQEAAKAKEPTKHTYEPDLEHRPGHDMTEKAKHREGTTAGSERARKVVEGAQKLREINDGMAGKVGHAIAEELTGFNAKESVDNISVMAEAAATKVLQHDPMRQQRAESAHKANKEAMEELSKRVEEFKEFKKTGEHPHAPEKEAIARGDKELLDRHGKGIESRKAEAVSTEAEQAARAHMEAYRREQAGKAQSATPAEEAFAAAGKAVRENLRFGAASAAVGKRAIEEWQPKHTIGDKVENKDLQQAGHEISLKDGVQGSKVGDLTRKVKSFDPTSLRPFGESVKLSPGDKVELERTEQMIDALDKKAEENKAKRKDLEKTKGYTAEEWEERAKLKDEIEKLEAKKKASMAEHQRKYGVFGKREISGEEKAYIDMREGAMDGFKKLADENKAPEIEKAESQIKQLDELAKQRKKSGSKGLTPEHAKHLEECTDALKIIDEISKSRSAEEIQKRKRQISELKGHHTPEATAQQRQLNKEINDIRKNPESVLSDSMKSEKKRFEAEKHDLEADQKFGLTRTERNERQRLYDKIETIKADDLYGLSEAERQLYKTYESEVANKNFEIKGGLSVEDAQRLQELNDQRTDQKRTRASGLTQGERRLKNHLLEQGKAIFEGAKARNEFVKEHKGETVRETGHGEGKEFYVGGLDSSDHVDPSKMESTFGGRMAKRVSTAAEAISFLGDAIKGSSETAQEYLDAGELAKAFAVAAGGLAKEGVGLAGSVAIPGLGKFSKEGIEALGGITHGVGEAVGAVADHAASKELQRERQRELFEGTRKETARENAIKWEGAVASEKTGWKERFEEGVGEVLEVTGAKELYDEKKAEYKALVEEFGQGVIADAQSLAGDKFNDAAHALKNEVIEPIQKAAEKAIDTVRETAATVTNELKDNVITPAKEAAEKAINTVGETAATVTNELKDNVITPAKEAAEEAIDTVVNIAETVTNELKDNVITPVEEFIRDAGNNEHVQNLAGDAKDAINEEINSAIEEKLTELRDKAKDEFAARYLGIEKGPIPSEIHQNPDPHTPEHTEAPAQEQLLDETDPHAYVADAIEQAKENYQAVTKMNPITRFFKSLFGQSFLPRTFNDTGRLPEHLRDAAKQVRDNPEHLQNLDDFDRELVRQATDTKAHKRPLFGYTDLKSFTKSWSGDPGRAPLDKLSPPDRLTFLERHGNEVRNRMEERLETLRNSSTRARQKGYEDRLIHTYKDVFKRPPPGYTESGTAQPTGLKRQGAGARKPATKKR